MKKTAALLALAAASMGAMDDLGYAPRRCRTTIGNTLSPREWRRRKNRRRMQRQSRRKNRG